MFGEIREKTIRLAPAYRVNDILEYHVFIFTAAIQLLRFAAKNERIRREWSNFCWTNMFYRKHIVSTGWCASDQRLLCGMPTFDANKDMHVRLQKLSTEHQ